MSENSLLAIEEKHEDTGEHNAEDEETKARNISLIRGNWRQADRKYCARFLLAASCLLRAHFAYEIRKPGSPLPQIGLPSCLPTVAREDETRSEVDCYRIIKNSVFVGAFPGARHTVL